MLKPSYLSFKEKKRPFHFPLKWKWHMVGVVLVNVLYIFSGRLFFICF